MDVIFKGRNDRNLLALTIDDFPSSGKDHSAEGSMALLDLLNDLQVPATFFCIGERIKDHPGLAARAAENGHELGNHMMRDQWSLLLPREEFMEQLDFTTEAIRKDLESNGIPCKPLRWFRPSGGWPTPQMTVWAEARGYRTVLGSIWPFDGIPIPLLTPEARLELQEQFVAHFAHPGGIIVMHDTSKSNPLTRETLATIVPKLRSRGYTFVTLGDLLESM